MDILGHEFTHGVITHTSKFAIMPKNKDMNKAFETGALNEGYPDILGRLIEEKNWTINESISTLRSLENPTSFGTVAVKGGQYYYPDGYLNDNETLEHFLSANDHDSGGIHQNSTVPSHVAYIMYKNGAFSSKEQMAKIWYNSLFLLSSYSNFEDCALAVIKTAQNQGLSSNSIKIIEEAFMETKMLEDTRIEISSIVNSGEMNLSNVKIELKAKNTGYTFTTDANGKFSEKNSSRNL